MRAKHQNLFMSEAVETIKRRSKGDAEYAVNAAVEMVFGAFPPDELIKRVESSARRLKQPEPLVLRRLCEIANRRREAEHEGGSSASRGSGPGVG